MFSTIVLDALTADYATRKMLMQLSFHISGTNVEQKADKLQRKHFKMHKSEKENFDAICVQTFDT